MRKRPGRHTVEDVERPEPGEVREIEALRANVPRTAARSPQSRCSTKRASAECPPRCARRPPWEESCAPAGKAELRTLTRRTSRLPAHRQVIWTFGVPGPRAPALSPIAARSRQAGGAHQALAPSPRIRWAPLASSSTSSAQKAGRSHCFIDRIPGAIRCRSRGVLERLHESCLSRLGRRPACARQLTGYPAPSSASAHVNAALAAPSAGGELRARPRGAQVWASTRPSRFAHSTTVPRTLDHVAARSAEKTTMSIGQSRLPSVRRSQQDFGAGRGRFPRAGG